MAKTTFICPYCFAKNPLSSVQFRCSSKRCVEVDDIEMTIYEHGDESMPKQGKYTFTPPGKNVFKVPASAPCPKCQNVTYKHVCPTCHNELPESTLSGRDMIISIVGARATGKSHFVGVIIKELRDRIAVSFDGAMEGFSDSYKRWQTTFGQYLYDQSRKLEDLTASSLVDVNNGAYRPLIFKLKLRKKSLFKKEIESFTFVFFDTAGEDLNDEDTMSTVNKYICKSAGIIFLLDPMQIPAVSNQLDPDEVSRALGKGNQGAMETRSDDIMTRVSNLIRHDRGMSEDSPIDIPVAAVFSKFDAIESLVPRGCTVLNPSPHCAEKTFDMSDWHNVNSEILALLREWGSEAFVSQVETNYKNYSYFAVSALGLQNNPDEQGNIKRPSPHRIEDPLLWILKENGVIRGK